jgi:nitrate reductase gamma subunit
MEWTNALRFFRGPFFHAALLIFAGGMIYRLVRIAALGWPRDRVKGRGSKAVGILKTYLKGLLVLPFIPWVKRTFTKNALTYVAGGLFHLGLFAVIFLGAPHMLVWKSLLGFGWPTLPGPLVDGLAAIAIAALLILLLNRLVHPVLKLLTRLPIWLNGAFVLLPMATGYMMTHHLVFRYEVLFSLHMIAVDALLIWIPLSRISHFLFYFFARTIHGAQAGKRGVTP